MPKRVDGIIRSFGMTGLQLSNQFEHIEERFNIELGHTASETKLRKSAEYKQFAASLRAEASRMSEYYEIFYCLENSIRTLVDDTLTEEEGADWWNSNRVDENKIRNNANRIRKKEIDSGIPPRSDRMIDYTTFGELSQLITDNWELFDPIFSSNAAVSRITNQLNVLRGAIAHCCRTDELAQDNLNLAVKSWFKLMS